MPGGRRREAPLGLVDHRQEPRVGGPRPGRWPCDAGRLVEPAIEARGQAGHRHQAVAGRIGTEVEAERDLALEHAYLVELPLPVETAALGQDLPDLGPEGPEVVLVGVEPVDDRRPEAEGGAQQRGVDPLALARSVPVPEGSHHCQCRRHAGTEVVDGRSGRKGNPVLRPVHEEPGATQGLDQDVVAAHLGIRALRSERGVGEVHDAGIHSPDTVPSDAEPVQVGSLHPDQHHVGPPEQSIQYLGCVIGTEVQNDAPLPGVDGRIGLRLAAAEVAEVAHGIATGWLDLDHVSAHAGQQAAAVWHRGVLGQLDHPDPVQHPRPALRGRGLRTHGGHWSPSTSSVLSGAPASSGPLLRNMESPPRHVD